MSFLLPIEMDANDSNDEETSKDLNPGLPFLSLGSYLLIHADAMNPICFSKANEGP